MTSVNLSLANNLLGVLDSWNFELRDTIGHTNFEVLRGLAEKARSEGSKEQVYRAALEKIAAFQPGEFRPLADEIEIHRLATTALKQGQGDGDGNVRPNSPAHDKRTEG